jgi:NodT family efflux transporter outer membrane factor (OMF) lipoprotein
MFLPITIVPFETSVLSVSIITRLLEAKMNLKPLPKVVTALLLLTLAGTVGCTHFQGWLHNGFKVGPDYSKPAAPIAENWIDFNGPAVISSPVDDRDWWRVFGDPALDSLVQATYQGNLPLHAQGQQVLEYRALRAMSVGNLFPQQQSMDGFIKRIQISKEGNLAGVPLPSRAFDLQNIGAGMQWELDVWGRFRRRIEQTNADVDQQVELYDDILSIAVADTAKAYTTYRVAQEFVRLARQNVEVQQGSLKIAEARFKAGAVGELDVTQAKSALHETEALIPRFQADERKANNELCILIGAPSRDLAAQVGEGSIPAAPTTVAVGIPGELMRRRPDIRAAERAVASASAEIGIAASDLFPHFSIDGSFSWTANQASDLFTPTAFGGIVGPSFRWDILNYGRLTNNVRRNEARFEKAAFKYQQTVLNANKEVENALISFQKSQQRAERLKDAVAATKRSVELAVIQYREGAIDFERIFNLQNVLVRQELDLAAARAEISLSLIEVYRSLRGGWQIRLDTSDVEELPPVEGDGKPPMPPMAE